MRLLAPFETSFGSTQERRIVLLRVTDGTHTGYGEVTAGEEPLYSHETSETAWHVLRDFIIPRTVGKEFAHARDYAPTVKHFRGHNMAKAGLENALWDLEAKANGIPLWKLLGGSRMRIQSGVSIGIQPSVDRLLRKIETELKAGYKRIKIKIKPGWDHDVLAEVRNVFPDILLMGDANSAYTLADIELFKRMEKFNLMMYEQPLHYEDIIDHAELQRQIKTPICLDESIHSVEDARKAIQIGACKIINLKVGRVSGHSEMQKIHELTSARGIPLWCGGMLESGVGRAHNVALSSLDNFKLPGDVSASKRYWQEDIIEPEVVVSSDGEIEQRLAPGIGYAVKEGLIEKLTVRCQTFSA